jgi:hypothetical protein
MIAPRRWIDRPSGASLSNDKCVRVTARGTVAKRNIWRAARDAPDYDLLKRSAPNFPIYIKCLGLI